MSKKEAYLSNEQILVLIEVNLILKDTDQKVFKCRNCKTLFQFNDMDNVCMCCGIGICRKCMERER